MKRITRSLTAVLLCAALCCALAAPALAVTVDGGTCGASGGNVLWDLERDGATITLYITGSGEMRDYAIDGDPEQGTPAPWYKYREEIDRIVVENGVTSIGNFAFNECSNCQSVKLGRDLKRIGNYALRWCLLDEIDIPSGVTSIGDGAFMMNEIRSIEIPEGVESVGNSLFLYCTGLKEASLPASLKSIGYNLFNRCDSLKEIRVASGNEYFFSLDGVLYTKDADTLLRFPPAKSGTVYTVPNVVTKIGDSAFLNCSGLTGIALPSGLIEIGGGAFKGCSSLTRFKIPSGVEVLDPGAFEGCSSLTEIAIPEGMSILQGYSFKDCKALKKVTIPECMQLVCNYAFEGCSSLTDVYYGGSEGQWARIDVRNGNEPLFDAEVHFARDGDWGDVDGSGVVDSDDAMLILRYDVKKIGKDKLKNFALADVDGSGVVDSDDAMLILRYDVKKIAKFPVEK